MRSFLLPLLLKESKTLISLQKLLLSYFPLYIFQLASFIGTHSFYLTILPIFFWIKYPLDPRSLELVEKNGSLLHFARGLVLNLAGGVCITCFLKDYLSLPRPQGKILRKSIVNYHSKEFGCPSTHSANATSISLFLHEFLSNHVYNHKVPWTVLSLLFIVTFFVISSRIALGMHGFLDIFTGMFIGFIVQIGISHSYDYLQIYLNNSTVVQGNILILTYSPCVISMFTFYSNILSTYTHVLLSLLYRFYLFYFCGCW